MDEEDARRYLRDDEAGFFLWCEAAAVLCNSPDSLFEDLLLCLSRRGLPAESGACKLYAVTHRPLRDDTVDTLVLDEQDWRDYLKLKGFINYTDNET